MKKVMTVMACLSIAALTAQPADSTAQNNKKLELEIEEDKVVIEATDAENLRFIDINKLMADAYKRTAEIEKQRKEAYMAIEEELAQGKITAEEAQELKEDADERAEDKLETLEDMMETSGEAYEARWEAWADEFEAKMEAWEAEMEAREGTGAPMPPMPALPPMPPIPGLENDDRTVIINEKGITLKRKDGNKEPFALRFDEEDEESEKDNSPSLFDDTDEDDKKKKSKKIDRSDSYFDIHFGFNQQLRNGNAVIAQVNADALNFWKSTSFNLGTGFKTRMGNPYSKFYIKYGIDFSWHNFRLEENNMIALDTANNRAVFVEDASGNVFEKSKYHISYFNIPVMLQLDFSEVGDMDEAFTLGVGGYGGVRMLAKRELEFSNSSFEEIEEKSYDPFFTSRFRYGLMAQVGFDSFKITASYDFNTFFEENRGPDYNMLNVSLGFTL